MQRAARVSLSLLFMLAASCASRAPVKLTAADNGKAIALSPGEGMEIMLDSNRSTGYEWTLVESSPAVVSAIGDPVYTQRSSGGGLIGAAGTEIWRLRALAPGRQTVRFEYRRPWEGTSPPARVVTFNVTVEE